MNTNSASPKMGMALMIGGVIAVTALVLWALTRTVDSPAAPPATSGIAAQTTAPPLATPADSSDAEHRSVPRITVDELRPQVQKGEVTVIDVRVAADYAIAHIPGAVNIPLASIETQIPYLPKAKPIITYCT